MYVGQTFSDFILPSFTSYDRDPGFFIRCVEIDNPTGQWLRLRDSELRVPPYTVNWRVNLPVASRTITIDPQPVQGFSTTTVGSPIRLVLYDQERPPQQGVSLVPNQPITQFEIFPFLFDDGTNHNLIVVPPDQRARIYMIGASYTNGMYNNAAPNDFFPPMVVTITIGGFGEWATLGLNAEHPTTIMPLTPGLDLAPGIDVQCRLDTWQNLGAFFGADVYAVYTLL